MAGHILLAEDDKALSALMQDFFRAAGVTVTPAYDGEQALVLAQEQPFDLLVLDVMMPHLNGLEVCEAVRQESDVPVIFVTALGQEGDTLAGFRAGADDYITKPFAIEELLARIRVILRKGSGKREEEGNVLSACGVLMNVASHTVTCEGKEIVLTNKEFSLLQTLLENKNIVLSRDTLLTRVWSYDYIGETNVVDVYVRYLRQKIDDAFGIRLIQTVRGIGYIIKDETA